MRVGVVVGTRPEAIKLAPVILELKSREGVECIVINTRQHPVLAAEMLGVFGIVADQTLDAFCQGQSLAELTSRLVLELGSCISEETFGWIVVQGDTTTAFIGALAGFYAGVPVSHVEAGLRTSVPNVPFPEEMNRRLISRLATMHFPPTARARECLIKENVEASSIVVTGNTVIDAAQWILEHVHIDQEAKIRDRYVLFTMHRRENWGPGVGAACEAVLRILELDSRIRVVFIKHPNPIVADLITELLGGHERVTLLAPQGYPEFLSLLKNCSFVVSDSGGVTEEAPLFNKHVLITRNETERMDAVDEGLATLVDANTENIVLKARELMMLKPSQSSVENPFGDGQAARRIVDSLLD